jgi:prepilin-type N-terminal cleavage/methylation domain-containing protein
MKNGFSLIEVVVAIAISSMIVLLLFNAFNQSGRVLNIVSGMISSDTKVTVFYDRFELDVSGAFIPRFGDVREVAKALAKQEQIVRVHEIERDEKSKPGEKKDPVKMVTWGDVQLQKPFVYEQVGDNLSLFSFVTCNPLEVHDAIKPRIVRVTYRLKSDKDKRLFVLTRAESASLLFDAASKDREYVLLNNVGSCKVSFLAEDLKEVSKEKKADKDVPAQQDKEARPLPMVKHDRWPLEQDSKEGDAVRDLPQFVVVTLVYKDPIEEVDKTYTYTIPIFSYYGPSKEFLRTPLITQQRVKKDTSDE